MKMSGSETNSQQKESSKVQVYWPDNDYKKSKKENP